MSLAILPGSYDPMTLGHLHLVERALEQSVPSLVAVLEQLPVQQKQYMIARLRAIRRREDEFLQFFECICECCKFCRKR